MRARERLILSSRLSVRFMPVGGVKTIASGIAAGRGSEVVGELLVTGEIAGTSLLRAEISCG